MFGGCWFEIVLIFVKCSELMLMIVIGWIDEC